MSEEETNSKIKKIDGLLLDKSATKDKFIVRNEDSLDCDRDGGENLIDEKEESKNLEIYNFELDDTAKLLNIYRIKLWGDKEIYINKSLFTFRMTLFLWYGAGNLPSDFLGIFLKQRGLAIVELSFVFSMIFLFQFLMAFITGIITDKIGNAKPVLMFLMLTTSLVLALMALTPNINTVICTELTENTNISNINNCSFCYINYFNNSNNTVEFPDNYTRNYNSSLDANFNLDLLNIKKTFCNFSISPLANMSLNTSQIDCCDACENGTETVCVTVRNEYLVVAYASLILAFFSFWSTSYRFIDYTILSLVTKNNSHYGKERAFATCGQLLIIILVGFVLNIDKSSGSKINFHSVIWTATGIKFCAFLTLLTNTVPILPPGRNLMKKASNLLRDIDILAFILIVFLAGNAFAFHSIFHLILLELINAPRIVVALHTVAVILFGIPVFFTSNWWLKKFGTNKLLILGLLFHTVNNTAYSYIENPWWSLIIDISKAFNFFLFWVAVVVHCQNVAPVGFGATLNALVGTVHFGIGRSSGVFFGGMIMNYVGLRKAYRIMGAVFFTAAILYSLFLFARRKSRSVNSSASGNRATEEKHSTNFESQDV